MFHRSTVQLWYTKVSRQPLYCSPYGFIGFRVRVRFGAADTTVRVQISDTTGKLRLGYG